MKDKKHLLLKLLCFTFMLGSTAAGAAACKDKPAEPSAPEGYDKTFTDVGSYYAGQDAKTNTFELTDSTFTLKLGEQTISGTYLFNGTVLRLVTTDGTIIEAAYSDAAIKITYAGTTYTFIKNVEYTVSFEMNGGSAQADVKVLNGQKLDKAALGKPTKGEAGEYAFFGWYKDAAFKDKYSFDQPVTKNVKLYARFVKLLGEKEFTLKLDGYTGTDFAGKTESGMIPYDFEQYKLEAKDGAEFDGWWYSAYNDETKLTAKMTTGDAVKENLVLYPVWKTDAPTVSVYEKEIVTTAKNNSAVTITCGEKTFNGAVQNGKYEFDFTKQPAGEYVITVTDGDKETKAYYKNKALARVSQFEVVVTDEGRSELHFNAVEHAEKYLITVVCGTNGHVHTDTEVKDDNGDVCTVFDFTDCDMNDGKITFAVKAEAADYLASESAEYTVDRKLSAPVNVVADDSTAMISWDAVEHAKYYILTIDGETFTLQPGVRTYDLRKYNKGEHTFSVVAVGNGWNKSDATTYTWTKGTLAAPEKPTIVNGYTVTWGAVEGAQGYMLKIGKKEIPVNGTSYTLTDKDYTEGQTTYAVSVLAKGATAAENSLYSDALTVTSGAMDGELKYENGTLSWNPGFGVTKYEIKVDNKEAAESIEVTKGTSAKITFTHAGTTTFYVRSYNANNEPSEWVEKIVAVYTVVFNTVKGEMVADELYLAEGDDIVLPETEPVATGYTFAGWFDGAGDDATEYKKENEVYPKLSAGEDLTLFAHWNSNTYRAIYDLGAYGTGLEMDGKDVLYGQDFTLDVPKSKDVNQVFAGWKTADGGSLVADQNGKGKNWAYAKDTKLVADWVKAIEYVTEGGITRAERPAAGAKYLTELTVLAEYSGNTVTRVAAGAFVGLSTITKIRIPDTVTEIVFEAFTRCSALAEIEVYKTGKVAEGDATFSAAGGALLQKKGNAGTVLYFFPAANNGDNGTYTIPDEVNTIGTQAFGKIKTLTKVIVPASVTSIEQSAFSDMKNLTEVEFLAAGDGAKEVGLTIAKEAFNGCSALVKMALPARLTSIELFNGDEQSAFKGCSKLKEIEVTGKGVEGVEAKYSSADGYLLNGNGDTIVYCPIAKYDYLKPEDRSQKVTIEVTIPDKVTMIGDRAFFGNKTINTVNIPARITYIGTSAFEGCTNIMSITFNGAEENADLEIKDSAFYYGIVGSGTLTELTLAPNVRKVGEHAFGGWVNLRTLYVESTGKVTFANGAFTGKTGYYKDRSTITTLHIGAGLEGVRINDVFNGMDGKLATVYLDAANTYYYEDDSVVYNRAMTEIFFFPKSKTEFKTPEKLTTIGGNLFAGRTNLAKITIGKNVTKISASAFANCKALAEVVFEKGGTAPLTIEEKAFVNCGEIAKLELPNRLTDIGNNVFERCYKVTQITFEDGAYNNLTIGAEAFRQCVALTSLTLPEGTVALGNGAFANCIELTTLEIPASMQRLGEWTRSGETTEGVATYSFVSLDLFKSDLVDGYAVKLEKIKVAEGNERYGSKNGILYGKYKDENDETTKTNDLVRLYFCPYNLKDDAIVNGVVTLPNTVQEIYQEAFQNNAVVKEVDFGSVGGTSFTIGKDAFVNATALTKMELPSGIATITDGMFRGCSGLVKVKIPNTVSLIEAGAFQGCVALADVEFDTGNDTNKLVLGDGTYTSSGGSGGGTEIRKGVFFYYYKYTYTSTTIKDERCFALTSITLPKRLSYVGKYAFYGCSNLTTVDFGENSNVETIAEEAFMDSGLTTIKLGKDVTAAADGSYTFTLPGNLKEIRAEAFRNVKLPDKTTMIIPASVTDFGNDPEKSGAVYMLGSVFGDTAVTKIVFEDNSQLQTIYPRAFKSQVKNSELTEVDFGKNSQLTTIGQKAFDGCGKLAKVNFGEGSKLQEIGGEAFRACVSLETISIPATVTAIKTEDTRIEDSGAFNHCTKLKTIVFETFADGENQGKCSLEIIGDKAFSYTGITSFEFKNTINPLVGGEGLGKELFYSCEKLGTVKICGTMSEFAPIFDGCRSDWKLEIPVDSGMQVDGSIVYNSDGTEIMFIIGDKFDADGKEGKLKLRDTLTKIGASMFAGKYTLKEIEIPAGVTEIGDKAFFDCINLEKVTFATYETDNEETGVKDGKNSLGAIGAEAFRNCISLQEIAIPEGVTALKPYTFFNCKSLTKVQLNKVARIGTNGKDTDSLSTSYGYVFAQCENLSNIDLSGVEWIQPYSFLNCKSLTSVALTALGDKQFGEAAFARCESLERVSWGQLTTLPSKAFIYCSALKYINNNTNNAIADLTSITTFNGNVFQYCTSLVDVRVNADLTSLGGTYLFDGCTALQNFSSESPSTIINPEDYKIDLSNFTTLKGYAFQGCTSIKEVVLGSAVLQSAMFQDCTALIKVSVAEGKDLKSPGTSKYPFKNCVNLKYVDFSNSTATKFILGDEFFDGCENLSVVKFSTAIEGNTSKFVQVGANAFRNCKALRSEDVMGENGEVIALAFPFKQVGKLGNSAFEGCTGLTEVVFGASFTASNSNGGTAVFKGCTNLKTVDLSKLLGTYVWESVFADCVNLETVKLNKTKITYVKASAFENCVKLKTLDFDPAKITSFNAKAFKNCKLLESLCADEADATNPAITLEKFTALTSIEANAFEGCTSLKRIKLVGVTVKNGKTEAKALTVYAAAFRHCLNLTEVILDGDVRFATSAPAAMDVFMGCDKLNAFKQTNADLGTYIFVEDGLLYKKAYNNTAKTVTYTLYFVPANYEITDGTVDLGAFERQETFTQDGAEWTNLYTANVYAFANCAGIKKLILADATTSITKNMFKDFMSIEEVVLSAATTTIGESAFENTGLKKITYKGYEGTDTFALPETLTTIGKYAFKDTKLKKVILSKTMTSVGIGAFSGSLLEDLTIQGENTAFAYTTKYSECTGSTLENVPYLTDVKFTADTALFTQYMFHGCTALKNVTLPSDKTANLAGYMFYGCTALTNVTLPSECTVVPEHLFDGCASLASVQIPETVTTISYWAFSGTAITEIDVPAGVTKMNQSFANANKLKKITLHEGLTSITVKAFMDCAALEEIVLPESLTEIGSDVFSGCVNLKKINIPAAVTKIGDNAFAGCTSLGKTEKFVIPATVTSVGSNAFEGWTADQTIHIEANFADVYNKWDNEATCGYSFMMLVKVSTVNTYVTFTGAKIVWNYKPETTGETEETGNTGTEGETEETGGTTNE